jgi:hypothetical protein
MASRAKRAKPRTRGSLAAAAAAADTLQPAYVIRCSRGSRILEYDEESFVDAHDPEEYSRVIDDDATAGDGVWVFDMGTRQQHGAQHQTPGLQRNTGILRVFSSKEAANAQAALVWRSLQANCPDREAPRNWQELLDEEEQQNAAWEGSSTKAKGTASSSSKHTGKKRKATAADPDSFRTMTADGRACWKREQHFYIDPWTDELKNVSVSTLTV